MNGKNETQNIEVNFDEARKKVRISNVNNRQIQFNFTIGDPKVQTTHIQHAK